MQTKQLVVGAILVDNLDKPTRFLGARRTKPAELAGRWEFPGGKVEQEETPTSALRRELREELSVEITTGTEVVAPDGNPWPISERYAMRVWLAEVTDGTLATTDSHDEYRWLTASDCMSVPWLDADIPITHTVQRLLT